MAGATYLDPILAKVRQRLAERQDAVALSDLIARAEAQPPAHGLGAVLRQPGIQLIAEVKRASPSKGPLNLDLDVAALVQAYEAGGAAAISVLTEPDYFHGSLSDLATVRAAIQLPILRKDFIVDAYQLWEARAGGADAILLIVAALTDDELRRLLRAGHRAGLEALVEVHDERELALALAAEARIIGINNRDLRDFTVSLDVTERLCRLVPSGQMIVSESGIRTRTDVARLAAMGVQGILVGETLVTATAPAAKIKELLGR